jgi:hypothetical protein
MPTMGTAELTVEKYARLPAGHDQVAVMTIERPAATDHCVMQRRNAPRGHRDSPVSAFAAGLLTSPTAVSTA